MAEDENPSKVLRLPEFTDESPTTWLTLAEAHLTANNVDNQRMKILSLISALPVILRDEVLTYLNSEAPDAYTELKNKIKNYNRPSEVTRIRQLMNAAPIGDRTPTQYLRHLRSLVDRPNDYLQILRRHIEDRIDQNISQILVGFNIVDIDEYAKRADELYDRFIKTPLNPICNSSLLGTPNASISMIMPDANKSFISSKSTVVDSTMTPQSFSTPRQPIQANEIAKLNDQINAMNIEKQESRLFQRLEDIERKMKESYERGTRAQEQRLDALERNIEYMQMELKRFKDHASRRDTSASNNYNRNYSQMSNSSNYNRDNSQYRDASYSNYGNRNQSPGRQTNRDVSNSNYGNRNQSPGRPTNRDNSPNQENPWCYYHRRWQHKATRCTLPCSFNRDRNEENKNSENP